MTMIETTPEGQPIPGNWYYIYLHDWRKAFPESGYTPGFYLGVTWRTYTPGWDEWWFTNQGVQMPTPVVTGFITWDEPQPVL
jgi:hypothetical protein